ncbi:MAG: excinuclease ABC subunit UvrA [Planctomycetota bacterium]|nr:excinuclease ABC subunit UvrA [Planctomycetota bacterium]
MVQVDAIRIRGARQHNLRGVDADVPLRSLTVVTGVSGSGKSSLAFDTLYAEGQRRYVETFSAYARQFLERMDRPDVDRIDGILPAVAIERSQPQRGTRSTVATMSELLDHLKLLWARAGSLSCKGCGRPVEREGPQRALDAIQALPRGSRVVVGFDLPLGSGREPADAATDLKAAGFTRVLVGDHAEALAPDGANLPRTGAVRVVVDRVVAGRTARARLLDSLETAFRGGAGAAVARVLGEAGAASRDLPFRVGLACPACGTDHRPPSPNLFSFNSPVGACEVCSGFGRTTGYDWDLVVPDVRRSIGDGAVRALEVGSARKARQQMLAWCRAAAVPLDVPWRELDGAQQRAVLHGADDWLGVAGWFAKREKKNYRIGVRVYLARYRGYPPCTACAGSRLGADGRAWRVGERTLPDVLGLDVDAARAFFRTVRTPPALRAVTTVLLREIRARLDCLEQVGLGYLTLNRSARTLSGGETQRVNLTAAIGTHLVNTLFVLDEPSVGLHARDGAKLVRLLRTLCDAGNTVVVVEHDPALLAAADHVIDMGPGAGEHGGLVVAQGTPAALCASPESVTGAWLAGRRRMEPTVAVEAAQGPEVGVRGARANNLHDVDLLLRCGALTVLSGVSGSGKSTLAHDTLYLAMARALGRPEGTPGAHAELVGAEHLDDVVLVDQAASGRSRRANIVTYSGAWDGVRKLFAKTDAAIEAGFGPGHFSFNVPGGRCETCAGEGRERVEMQFLSDVEVPCPECDGTRFKPEVRDVTWSGLSIDDVLALTVVQALDRFAGVPAVVRGLAPVFEVGLGYLRLGQSLSTLSSGEWQRLRLSGALGEKPGAARRLYVFDEPTTGLHLEDVAVLLRALRRLVERGHAVLVVEHHLDVLAAADRVVDLGPEGGPGGGRVVADGPPAVVARGDGHTAQALRAAGRKGGLRTRLRKRPPPPPKTISIHGAREHNLRNVSVDLPRDQFVVVSGPSGSGKSTLAFDIVFAEGQRRYIDTLSAYARQFVGQLARPAVDSVTGIPPTVAIEQRRSRGGRRSTVATVTEVAHFLRLLFARAGEPHCPTCGDALRRFTPEALLERLQADHANTAVQLLAPRVLGRKGFHKDVFAAMVRRGRTHARVNGEVLPLKPLPKLDRYREHDIEEIVAALTLAQRANHALRAALDEALVLGGGTVGVLAPDGTYRLLSTRRTCPRDGATVPEPDPRMFSHNSRRGWCPACRGLGTEAHVDADGLRLEEARTLARGAVPALGSFPEVKRSFVREARAAFGTAVTAPWAKLPAPLRRTLLHGGKAKGGVFVGAAERLQAAFAQAPDIAIDWFGDYVTRQPCSACAGERLRAEARAVRVGGARLPELLGLATERFLPALEALPLASRAASIAEPILREIRERVAFLERMGLGYLTLDRTASTLSGGEAQRIRLAAQLGSNLRGICYVLDEPTIGLHARDNARLLAALQDLRARGNSLIVVEHDADTIRQADRVIDLGPGGGRRGGHVVAEGTPAALAGNPDSPTGRVLARPVPTLNRARLPAGPALEVVGARRHNLEDVDISVPLGRLVCVTGVSGAGKSTLVHGVLAAGVRAAHAGDRAAQPFRALRGAEHLTRVREVDSSPVGRTPRSVPATFLGIWDQVRKALALTQEARARGYGPGRFSFNTAAGRCESCDGMGEITVEMSFLPDVRIPCERCAGARFAPETLEITWRGRHAGHLLELTFEEAGEVFVDFPQVAPRVELMNDVGLGHLSLGQPSPTLSGGEAQRLKLVSELGRGGRDGPTLYVLDEPTIGLHGEDVDRLLAVFRRLVERGDTVLLIEHHLELVAQADHVIDLGPEGGVRGGRVVAAGTPAAIARRRAHSATGAALYAMCNKSALAVADEGA